MGFECRLSIFPPFFLSLFISQFPNLSLIRGTGWRQLRQVVEAEIESRRHELDMENGGRGFLRHHPSALGQHGVSMACGSCYGQLTSERACLGRSRPDPSCGGVSLQEWQKLGTSQSESVIRIT